MTRELLAALAGTGRVLVRRVAEVEDVDVGSDANCIVVEEASCTRGSGPWTRGSGRNHGDAMGEIAVLCLLCCRDSDLSCLWTVIIVRDFNNRIS